eukprot:6062203-Karenia_brevis.AAC.1
MDEVMEGLEMNEEGRRRLMQTCRDYDSRVQTKQLGHRIHYWVQSIHVGTDEGGRVWTETKDGAVWMNLGGVKISS